MKYLTEKGLYITAKSKKAAAILAESYSMGRLVSSVRKEAPVRKWAVMDETTEEVMPCTKSLALNAGEGFNPMVWVSNEWRYATNRDQ